MPPLNESLTRLYERRNAGVKLGLEATLDLLARLGDPQDGLAVVHIAGTNGKGSVAAMIESALRSAGLSTGLFTSPHLVRLNERFRINGACLDDDALLELIATVEPAAEAATAAPGGREITFFEYTAAMAYALFRDRGVNVAVVETGLGGRLDATNVIDPVVSVITSIALDHVSSLGSTFGAIAREKCGIVKPSRPVVCGPVPDEAAEVIHRICAERSAPLRHARDLVAVERRSGDLHGQKLRVETANAAYGIVDLPFAGACQVDNCAIAVAAVEAFADAAGIDFDPKKIVKGLAAARWPGRMHIVETDPVVIVDGAHNADAATRLAATLADLLDHRPLGLVVGLSDGRDAESFMKPFARLARRCWAVPLVDREYTDPVEIERAAAGGGCPASSTTLAAAVEEGRQWAAAENGVLCITGSLYLAGEFFAAHPDIPLFPPA